MKIARYICWQLDSTLRPTMKRGFDIIPAQPELISVFTDFAEVYAAGLYSVRAVSTQQRN